MELSFIGLDMAYISFLVGVWECVGPPARLVTRAVTQAHLAYGIFYHGEVNTVGRPGE